MLAASSAARRRGPLQRQARWLSADAAAARGPLFRRRFGLEWCLTKDALLESNPGPVLVAQSYEWEKDGEVSQARRYSSFKSHKAYWESIDECRRRGLEQNFHEVLTEGQRRCLYFDLDGPPPYLTERDKIVDLLKQSLWWFFGGARRGWDERQAVQPVVLAGQSADKFSVHVVFPDVQFDDHAHQMQYLNAYLSILPDLTVGGHPLLHELVDSVPYTRFQLFRGPFACKLRDGSLRPDTSLEPNMQFNGDPLTCFAGYANPDYALELPSVEQLLSENEALNKLYKERRGRILRATGGQASSADQFNLYNDSFQTDRKGEADFCGLSPVETFEMALNMVHPLRASQWWSWFRISGVTTAMLELHSCDAAARKRILDAHVVWSRGYENFDYGENLGMIERSAGCRVSGLPLLVRIACFDNPMMQIRQPAKQLVV